MHRRLSALAILCVGAGALASWAGAAPNAPAVPTEARAQARIFLQEIGGPDLLFLPTRLPTRYAYQSYSVTGTPLDLDLAFVDQQYTSNSTKIREHEILFDVTYLGKAPCSRGSQGVMTAQGMRLFHTRTKVWRCVASASGKQVKETATGNIGSTKLAVLVTSAKRG